MNALKIILSPLVFLVFMTGTSLQAQSIKDKQAETQTVYNYVVLTKKVGQLKPILMAAQSLLKENEKEYGDFQIIICGKDIGEIADRKRMERFIKEAQNLKASIVACGFSLKKFEVDPDKIPENIKVIDNGILYNMELQKRGYLSLEL